jgi:hypothetical protein
MQRSLPDGPGATDRKRTAAVAVVGSSRSCFGVLVLMKAATPSRNSAIAATINTCDDFNRIVWSELLRL